MPNYITVLGVDPGIHNCGISFNKYDFELVSIKSDTKHCIFGYYISKDRGLVCEWSDTKNEDWVFIPLKTKSIKEYYQKHKGENMSQLTFVREALGLPPEISSEEKLISYLKK